MRFPRQCEVLFCQARFVSCGYSRHAGEVRDPFGSRGRILIARIEDKGSWEGKAVLASGVLQARVAVFHDALSLLEC